MSKKPITFLLNSFLLCVALGVGYVLTVYYDHLPPQSEDFGVIESADNKPLPNFVFTDLNGKEHKLPDFRGKILLINFWATWCPPCVVEFPAMLKIAAQNPDDVVLIALSSDVDLNNVEKFMQYQKTPTKNVYIAYDQAMIVGSLFKIDSLPETIIADPELIQRQKIIGADWKPEEMQKIIDTLKP